MAVESTRRVRGVALIVKHPIIRRILILDELEEKPIVGKHPGTSSIPMETAKDGEEHDGTIHRLLEEELPGLRTSGKHTLIGTYEVAPGIWVNLYVTTMKQWILPRSLCKATGEVENHRLMGPKKALKLSLRGGAREMIEDYAEGRTNCVRICKRVPPPKS